MTKASGFQLAGTGPERYERYVSLVMAPLVDAVLSAADLKSGDHVLDLACGTGFVARGAARIVGGTGRVVGVDANTGMLDAARAAETSPALDGRRAARAVPTTAAPSIEWIEGRAGHVDMPDGGFHAVLCQQGMQFFDDLVLAVRDSARMLRAGGRLVATVWAPFERSPYLHAQGAAIWTLLGEEAFASFEAAASCAPEKLADAYVGAGLHNVRTEEVHGRIDVPDFRNFAVGHLSALPWGALLAERVDDGLAKAAEIVVAELGPSVEADGSLSTIVVSTLAVGTKPA